MTTAASTAGPAEWRRRRRSVLRDATGIGMAVGAYGLSYGALGPTAGLSVPQTCALSVLAFTGGSQFAFVGIVGGGGSFLSAGAAALALGARNALYGLRLAPLLKLHGAPRLLGAHLVIDESTAMAVRHAGDGAGQPDAVREGERAGQLAFWATGLAVFVLWNLATLLGALGATAFGDPRALGLDAAVGAAFLGLLWPRLRERRALALAGLAAVVALALTPAVPAGVPVLAAGVVAVVAGLR